MTSRASHVFTLLSAALLLIASVPTMALAGGLSESHPPEGAPVKVRFSESNGVSLVIVTVVSPGGRLFGTVALSANGAPFGQLHLRIDTSTSQEVVMPLEPTAGPTNVCAKFVGRDFYTELGYAVALGRDCQVFVPTRLLAGPGDAAAEGLAGRTPGRLRFSARITR